jgi:hypothetical protein
MNLSTTNPSPNTNPKINIMARQNIYIRPRLNPANEKYFSDSSDDSSVPTDSNSKSSSLFSSNESLFSFEDYKAPIDLDEHKFNNTTLSECNRGIITSICCSWCSRS